MAGIECRILALPIAGEYAERVKTPDLSIIAPARNEADNVEHLVDEIAQTLSGARWRFEIIVVDDDSTDDTLTRLRHTQRSVSNLRVLALTSETPRRSAGQSAAFAAALRVARGHLIAMIDADLQNDPADLLPMVELVLDGRADLVQGDRTRHRADNIVRRITSHIGRLSRRIMLGDTIRDTGCSLRVMTRELASRLPLEFRGMHRFIPFMARELGFRVVECPVNHRPRLRGRTKYGIFNRALPGVIDLLAVRWMQTRRHRASAHEHQPWQMNAPMPEIEIRIDPDPQSDPQRDPHRTDLQAEPHRTRAAG